MGTGTLTIDLDAIAANWRALDAATSSTVQTAAVVKANGYGLGAGRVARALAQTGARQFFVAVAEEGAAVREALGPGPQICIFSGHMAGDTDMIADLDLTPMLNSPDQLTRHINALPLQPFGIQLDTGMNRLGFEPQDWADARGLLHDRPPVLIISHLANADAPDHPQNDIQLDAFVAMTEGMKAPRSLAATGGILLSRDYHFDLTRPGVGLYGGLPFDQAASVVTLSLDVIQTRDLIPGETVGYGAAWLAEGPARIATVAAGYGDGLIRALGNGATLFADGIACPLAGRVSMDLLTIDITHLGFEPRTLDVLGSDQTVDDVARAAGTIGYEILTSLGSRYRRRYKGGAA